jgi:hypothetical protein
MRARNDALVLAAGVALLGLVALVAAATYLNQVATARQLHAAKTALAGRPPPTATAPFPTLTLVPTATTVPTATRVPTATPTAVPTATPAPVSLPLSPLPAICTVGTCQFVYPASLVATMPASAVGRLGAYGVAGRLVLGPAEWTGEGRLDGQGNLTASLRPLGAAGSSGARLDLALESGPAAVLDAAPYFPEARAAGRRAGLAVPPPLAGLVESVIQPGLVAYGLPSPTSGLGIDGVAYFQDAAGGAVFKREAIVLPLADRSLSTVILNDFLARLDQAPLAMVQPTATPTPVPACGPPQTQTFTLNPGRTITIYQARLDPTRWVYTWLALTSRGGGYVTWAVDSAGRKVYGDQYQTGPLPVFEPPDVDVYTFNVQNNAWFATGSYRFEVQVCRAGTAPP